MSFSALKEAPVLSTLGQFLSVILFLLIYLGQVDRSRLTDVLISIGLLLWAGGSAAFLGKKFFKKVGK